MTKRNQPLATVHTRPGLKSDISGDALRRWNPDIKASVRADADAATISVLDPIGADYFGDGVTAKRIGAALRQIGDGDVTVSINSPGGDFFEGLAIYNQLVEHKGAVTVKILGLAASAASVIAMAGDRIEIARAGFLMIHNTWVMAAGDKHALREVAHWLEPFDAAAVDVYHARTGTDAKELAKMLDAETWISGADAVDRGFADGLLSEDDVSPSAKASRDVALSAVAAAKKIDLLMARQDMPRSERRELVAALKSGTHDAADDGTRTAADTGKHDAAERELAQRALARLSNL
ncbi:Clp protease ClpP [Sagittula sp. NFXS13]|uniref:head maturation protease, ClpP-related n=1 Tax=Sagittula sp. NFXS13 TaxID=2819095 RepID=UPI0032E02658